ncbi:MAG: AbrB family transcriptional regulator [Thermoplasmatota archaeon]
MSRIVETDKKGRLYLSKGIREKYGQKILQIELEDEIKLIPTPDDPVKDLQKVTDKLKGKSMEDMKKEIREEALNSMG